nr:probable E3 ubiquitin-protein ligase bre1 isoform X1 [Onthophagus taurus]
MQQVISDFNPGKSNSLTARQWIKSAESLAMIFKWDDQTLLYNAIIKLNGAAKLWFESVQNVVYDWKTFKKQLIDDFPTVVDEADIHFDLSKRVKRGDETYEHYVYNMKAIASAGDFSDRAVLKYIIAGIQDKELSKLLAISLPIDTQDLLLKIKSYESTIKTNSVKMPSTSNKDYNRASGSADNRKCYNCNEIGHISTKCPKPQNRNRCFRCDKVGHIAKNCRETSAKGVHQIQIHKPLGDLRKIVEVNGEQIVAFIDLGSEVVTMREKDAIRLHLGYISCVIYLRGFGGGEGKTIGKTRCIVKIDDVTIEVEIFIVPDECQDDSIIIGNSAFEDPEIQIIKQGHSLKVHRVLKEDPLYINMVKGRDEENENKEDEENENKEGEENENKEDEENRNEEDEEKGDSEEENADEGDEDEPIQDNKMEENEDSNQYEMPEDLRENEKQTLRKLIQDNESCFASYFGEIGLNNKLRKKIENKIIKVVKKYKKNVLKNKENSNKKNNVNNNKNVNVNKKKKNDINANNNSCNKNGKDYKKNEKNCNKKEKSNNKKRNDENKKKKNNTNVNKDEKMQKIQKDISDKKYKQPRRYQEGDLVLIKREASATGQPRKMMPLYKGPYLVNEVLGNDRYHLVDVPGAQRTQRKFNSIFAADLMKPWCQLPEDFEERIEDDSNSSEAECSVIY